MAKKKKKSFKVPLIAAGVVVLGLMGIGASGGESEPEPAVAETAVVETVERSAPEPVAETTAPEPVAETTAPEPVAETAAPEPVVDVAEPEQKDTPSPSVETEAAAEKSEPAPEPQKLTVAVHNAGRSVSLAPDTLVWLSATGTKFHRKNDCGTMNPDKARQVTVENAVNKGFDACERCY